MKIKTLYKKFFSVVLAVMIVVSMACVGFTANAATMQYNIDYSKKASLTIYKYEMPDTSTATHGGTGEQNDAQYVPEDATPLADVTFTIYKVAELGDYFKSTSSELPDVSSVDKKKATAQYSATTGEDGLCTFTDLPLGIYYVEETDGPAQVTEKIAPFVISLPLTNTDGTEWLYDVYCYPKNQTAYGGVTVKKVDSTTAKPLEGAEFTLYTSDDGVDYTEYLTGIKTASNGCAVIENLPSQTYYKFVETKTSDPSYILDSTVGYEFYVDGTGDVMVNDEVVENRTITVGNDTVEIHKYILDGEKGAEGIDNTADYGDTVYWKIKTTIPSNSSKLTTYTIVDTMSTGLKYDSAELWLDDRILLKENTDYTVSQDGLNVTFTIDPKKLGDAKEVEVYFNTILTEEALLATDIPNTSKLIYTNDIGTTSTYEKTSETPTVHTGGYVFTKTDGSKPLKDTTFAIYASEEDAKSGKNAILTKTSGADGVIEFKGLKYGSFSADEAGKNTNGVVNGSTDYWIAETDAPDGYILLSAPVKVTINNKSHIAGNNDDVINSLLPELPKTGAVGTIALLSLSAALIASGVILYFSRRRKRENG